MKSRLTLCLLSALLVVAVPRFDAYGQDAPAVNDRDLVELLEMQLADAQRENTRLAADLKKQSQALEAQGTHDEKAEFTAAKRKREEQNALLKSELTKLERDLEASVKSRDDIASKLEASDKARSARDLELTALQELLKRAEKASVEATTDTRNTEELKARCRNLEDENAIITQELAKLRNAPVGDARAKQLMSEVNEMKAVDAQRKEALDDLFKQLADVKGSLKGRDSEIAALRTEVASGRDALRARDKELEAKGAQLADGQETLHSLKQELESVSGKLQGAEARVSEKDGEVRAEIAARQAIEIQLDRIKITDEQRKKAMDDVLTKLAIAESRNTESANRIGLLEREAAAAKVQGTSTISGLEKRAETLAAEVTRLENELSSATGAKDALAAKLAEHEAAAQRDTDRLVSLESELARVTATDNQRRKAMDKLLLEIAVQEQAGDTLRSDVDAARQEVVAIKAQFAANPEAVSPDAAARLAELEAANAELRKTVDTLESQSRDLAAVAAATDDGRSAAEAVRAAQSEWQKSKDSLEKEMQDLRAAGEKQAEMVSSLKADLTEAERAKAQLADEANQLRKREVDVRKTALFKELEQVNETFREKLVQVESERQRLAKNAKKLEKRDESYDDEIGHEKQLRQKSETDLADARSREVEYQELIERLTAQVPQLEKQVAVLEDGRRALAKTLTDREEDLRALKMELDKREHRLVKAERVAEVLESAREDVVHESDREKLDMHYNMAAVYAREGKFEAAEQEYLHALRLNPLDADVHYNLGILYDDELKSPTKAVVHYRRYLSLNPHGPEADQVRDWLMKLEMKMNR